LLVGERAARVVDLGPSAPRAPGSSRSLAKVIALAIAALLVIWTVFAVLRPLLVYLFGLAFLIPLLLVPWTPLLLMPWWQDRVVAREHAALGEHVLPPAVARGRMVQA
jgi:Flp pilus assembly protein TadB